MRKSRLVIAALFMLTIQLVKANTIDPTINERLRVEIAKLMSDVKWEDSKKFNISFIVTKNNEIVVTSTSDASIDEEVKALLNYKKLDITGITPNEIFVLPVTIVK
jgi:hypothetical protein